jgi:hypothetical protein
MPNMELGIGDIFRTRDNSTSRGREKCEAPLLAAVDDAHVEAPRASELGVAGGTGVQRSTRCECEERKGEGDHGRKHYNEQSNSIYQVIVKEDTERS